MVHIVNFNPIKNGVYILVEFSIWIRNKSFISAVLSAPLYSTDLIDGKCLKVNFLLQTSYNLDINSINNSRKDIFTLSSMCNNDQKGLHFMIIF